MWYNGYYPALPMLGTGFDSQHAQNILLQYILVKPFSSFYLLGVFFPMFVKRHFCFFQNSLALGERLMASFASR